MKMCLDREVDTTMSIFENISPLNLTLFAVAVALIAIGTLDNAQVTVIGNLLIGIGGLMIIAASQQDYLTGLDEAASRTETLKKQIELLQKQMEVVRSCKP